MASAEKDDTKKKVCSEMMDAASLGNLEKVKRITAKYGLSHCEEWQDGYAVLCKSLQIFVDEPHVATFLVEAGAKLTDGDEKKTLFHEVVARNCRFFPVVKALLSRGASVHSRDKSGNTPLHCVRVFTIAKLLFSPLAESPPNVHAVNNQGLTPLHMAAGRGNSRLTEFLLKHGADVNCRAAANQELYTPLHAAAAAQFCSGADSAKTSKALLRAGARINARNSAGRTPLHLAAAKYRPTTGHLEVLGSWPDVDIDAIDKEGKTALAIAAEKLYWISVSTLLEYGADVNITNNGLTPVQAIEKYRSTGPEQCRSFPTERVLRVSMVLRSHVAKLKCADLPVSEDNLMACKRTRYDGEPVTRDHIWETLDDPPFVKYCKEEVEKMRKEKIGDSCVSYYDVLSQSSRQLASLSKNAAVSRAMNSKESVVDKFPVYGRWIDVRYRRAERRAQLQGKAVSSLTAMFQFLPHLCTELIADYLSNEDLKSCCDCYSGPDD